MSHDDTAGTPSELPDLTTKINSSVSGFVTNENNAPVENALVLFGGTSVSTDQYGFFEIKNVEVTKTAAFVTITKAGYFKAIKTYAATEGKAAFFRIKMILKTTAGTISSTTGGIVSLSNGLAVALPANAVMIASNGNTYTGDIQVAASWINPEAADLTGIMPGDLRGIDSNGELKGLTTYGMAAVELTTTTGELLQIATGKTATITMPLSSTLAAAAPSSIPLWYFNENNGLWKEEGSAVKVGNTYTGEVAHFSYWNCDLPNATVPLSFRIVNAEGNPVANAMVEIVPTTAGSSSHIGGYTDETGYLSTFATPNNTYSFTLYSTCNLSGGIPDYSTTFSVANTAVNLGDIAVASAITANVTGTVTDCNGHPLSRGRIFVYNGYNYSCYNVDNAGSYNFNLILCQGTTNVALIAKDSSGIQQSAAIPHTIVAGNNTIPNLITCGGPTEFVHLSVDGGATFHDYTVPPDDFLLYSYGSGNTLYFSATDMSGSNTNTSVEWSFYYTGIAVGSIQELRYISGSDFPEPISLSNPIWINITEYDPVTGYISGNFTGSVTGTASPYNSHQVVCTFRLRRVG